MREFTTAVEAADRKKKKKDLPFEFKLDGREFSYYRPSDGQIIMYWADNGKRADTPTRVAATIDLFMGLFDDADQVYFASRLMDRDDAFGIEKIQEIMRGMMEDWSGRPTESAPASLPSRRSAGQRSSRATTRST